MTEPKQPKMKRLLPILFVLSMALDASASIIYVKSDASGARNGASWKDAYTNLYDFTPSTNDTIYMANGWYLAAKKSTESLSFKRLVIYGGFQGFETTPSQRDFSKMNTIISGNTGSLTDTSDNIHGLFSPTFPGGLYANGIMIELAVGAGGSSKGSLAEGPQLFFTFEHCIFKGNGKTIQNGGLFYATQGSNFLFIDCSFIDNEARLWGGVIYLYKATASFVRCRFHGNKATYGSIVWAETESSANFENCLFSGNKSRGDIVWITDESDLSMVSCTFYNNHPDSGYGSGIYLRKKSSARVYSSAFWKNDSVGAVTKDYFIRFDASSTMDTQNCFVQNIQKGFPHFYDSLGADGKAGTPDDILIPTRGSALFQKASALTGTSIDITGRKRGSIQDIGAFEHDPTKDCVPPKLGSSTFCKGSTFQFTTTPYNGEVLKWFLDPDSQKPVDSGFQYTNTGFSSDTVVYYTIEDTINLCKSKLMRALPVKQLASPKASFLLKSHCLNDTVALENDANSGDGIDSFKWMLNETFVSSDSVPTIVMKDTGRQTLALQTLSPNGCTSQTDTVFNVSPLPDASIQIDFISSLKYLLIAANSANGVAYLWDISDGSQKTGSSIVHQFSEASAYTIKLKAEDDDGCFTESDTVLTETVLATHPLEKGKITMSFSSENVKVTNPEKLLLQQIHFYGVDGKLHKTTSLYDTNERVLVEWPQNAPNVLMVALLAENQQTSVLIRRER